MQSRQTIPNPQHTTQTDFKWFKNQTRRKDEHTLMVRSGGRAQTTELCLVARLRAERLPASSKKVPILRAWSMRRVWSKSEGKESRSLSNERSIQMEDESERPKKASRRRSIWVKVGILGFCDGHGRFAMDDGGEVWTWKRASIAAAGGHERRRVGRRKKEKKEYGRASECHVSVWGAKFE